MKSFQFTCMEHNIDDRYYIYGPSEAYPNSPDRQLFHRGDKKFKAIDRF